MIDLTPLDVRNKRGDFKKLMRGYDPQAVDVFLEIVADRLEALVRENIQFRQHTQTLQSQVDSQLVREQAVQNALVTAQELRTEMQNQTQREVEHVIKEAEMEARQLLADADVEVRSRLRGVERRLDQAQHAVDDLERSRNRFLKEFRGLLEREMDVLSIEEARIPLEDRTIDLDLGGSRAESSEIQDLRVEVEEVPEATKTPDAQSTVPSVAAPDMATEPTPLELELMAGAEHASRQTSPEAEGEHVHGVPDLNTVLAEAGVEEVRPPSDEAMALPPTPTTPRDNPGLNAPNATDRQ
ncbi:MAG: DivIVA domain-containing protein [Longimicrobiales bacterium]|nr:DivIVA domain-containing protein [Longimicrobiales bacterium]